MPTGDLPSASDFAILVCTRNRPEMLRSALASIARCSPPGVEVLVVDSASDTLRTREVAEELGTPYVRADVPGLSIARNVGLRVATRRFVMFTDDDCLTVPGWLDGVIPLFVDPRVGAVTGRMLDHTLVGSSVPYDHKTRFSRAAEGLDAGHGAVMAFRRDILLRLGGFDEALGAGERWAGAEDLDMFCRILDAGSTIVHEEKCVVHHVNTRVGDAYTELHRGYGLGLGALVNKWVRTRPLTGLALAFTLARRWVLDVVRERTVRPVQRAMLSGMIRGFVEASRLPLEAERFVRERRGPREDEATV